MGARLWLNQPLDLARHPTSHGDRFSWGWLGYRLVCEGGRRDTQQRERNRSEEAVHEEVVLKFRWAHVEDPGRHIAVSLARDCEVLPGEPAAVDAPCEALGNPSRITSGEALHIGGRGASTAFQAVSRDV